MTKTICGCGSGQGNLATASAVSFLAVGCNGNQSTLTTSGGENIRQHKMGVAGRFTNLSIKPTVNGRSTTTDIRLRVNGADGNLHIAVPAASVAAASDDTNVDTVAVGDLVCLTQVLGTGAGNFHVGQAVMMGFEALSGQTVSIYSACGTAAQTITTASTNRYCQVMGTMQTSANTSLHRREIYGLGGVISNFQIWVSANTRTTDTTVTLRDAATDTAITFTVAAGVTGLIQDTTHTYSFSAGASLDARITTGTGLGTFGFDRMSFEITWPGQTSIANACPQANSTTDGAPESWWKPFGGDSARTASATPAQYGRFPFNFRMSGFKMRVGYTTVDVTYIMALNGTDTSLAITVPAGGGTAPYDGGTSVVDVVAGDLGNMHHRRVGGSNINNHEVLEYQVFPEPHETPFSVAIVDEAC